MGRILRFVGGGILLVLSVAVLASIAPIDVPLLGPALDRLAGILGQIAFWGLIAFVLLALVFWIFPTPSRR